MSDPNNTSYYEYFFGLVDNDENQENGGDYDGHINDASDRQRELQRMSADEIEEFDRDYVINQAENY